ncbi:MULTISPECIES: undecaprenyl-diphosphate phosphatase [unclassified Hyphomonas]|jgi:undecaprenyl-diphosphatase|uniref:undecaprenyl-diphosphate phosphatase n=2 Tax=Hyphomonas TaxID=85 RepID=UPI000C394F2C|nr:MULTISPECIES: undecaprenyl-diphosphate phosphatase [unclassified Hyphomonas]MAL44163.1 UDP-diphosphatase [Hyphomonas sp.]MAX84722.1 UDP-diphosphatase [Hyphomonas sp.]MDF1806627.1 undecaprenyl-diphosphate phosphatase [Hyphomonas sp.]RCL86886.1 MAG: undecaprenyl-diphosphate phosphatase [Hyphomonas sp.]HAO37292.1 UDP-diphosphatase [Hyphomonas sp.]|tara:strand:- start:6636 stop:7487 length:852 start_codon:yes stop_codon:yes gene_type:complete
MSLLQLAIIALLQGTTEWLPVSSSGHVLLAAGFFEASPGDELLINAVSNLGTLLAMLIYFRKDVTSAIAGGFELVAAPVSKSPLSKGARLAAAVIVATPVAVLVAFAYEKFLPESMLESMRSIYVVAATTIIFGALLWWADVKGARDRREEDMTMWHAFLIGATQAIAAILPGTSRSGITMTAARAFGYDRTEAARFSMLIGAPILAAAGLYGAMGLVTADATETVLTLKDGLIVASIAFITGLASIWFLMSLLSRMSFLPFVLYRFALGAVLILGSPLVGLL